MIPHMWTSCRMCLESSANKSGKLQFQGFNLLLLVSPYLIRNTNTQLMNLKEEWDERWTCENSLKKTCVCDPIRYNFILGRGGRVSSVLNKHHTKMYFRELFDHFYVSIAGPKNLYITHETSRGFKIHFLFQLPEKFGLSSNLLLCMCWVWDENENQSFWVSFKLLILSVVVAQGLLTASVLRWRLIHFKSVLDSSATRCATLQCCKNVNIARTTIIPINPISLSCLSQLEDEQKI